jgi:3-phenylpropionate/trans-cinnamate dioxygenase ferredoxin reductase subunit
MERVLIVGNGYAGLAAAGALSAAGGFSVTVVSAEETPAYCPHLLPEMAAGGKEEPDLLLPAPGGVSLRLGDPVVSLSPGRRVARLAGGSEIGFDKALIASGAVPYVPAPLVEPLARCANVLTLKRLRDAAALREALRRGARRVVVVGAGRVGVLLAEALSGKEAEVSLVEKAGEILPAMLEPGLAAPLRRGLEARRNTSVFTGRAVGAVRAEGGKARAVVLSDGAELPCDVVVVAAGVVPNTGFLSDGLADPRGLPVNERMETAAPGLYAAGDVVRFTTATGREEPGQLALNARVQGEAAARNIAGETAVCPPMFVGNVVRVGNLIGARIGDIDGTGRQDLAIGKSRARLTLDGLAVTGLQFAGFPDDLRGLVPLVMSNFSRDEAARVAAGFPVAASLPIHLLRAF